jgi:hypothetical protein
LESDHRVPLDVGFQRLYGLDWLYGFDRIYRIYRVDRFHRVDGLHRLYGLGRHLCRGLELNGCLHRRHDRQ